MPIEITDEAIEVLRRSLSLGGVDPARGGVRLRAARTLGGGVDIQVELADGPMDREEVLERDGVRVFVDPGVTQEIPNAVVTVEPQHDMIVVRPGEKPS